MGKTIRADGDTWRVRLSERPPHPGVQAVVFFCASNGQRPWRVVEVPESRIPDVAALERLPEAELRDLFAATRSMDYPHTYAG